MVPKSAYYGLMDTVFEDVKVIPHRDIRLVGSQRMCSLISLQSIAPPLLPAHLCTLSNVGNPTVVMR